MANWEFFDLRHAFPDAVGTSLRTLMVYSDVVRSNLMGDTKHSLVREVVYKRDISGSLYVEP